MKRTLAFLTLLLLLPACAAPAAEPTATRAAAGPTDIQVAVATNDFVAGRPRVPFVLFAGPDEVADATAVQVTAFDLAVDPPAAGWQGAAVNYSDYEVPYWVVTPDLPRAGNWGLSAAITKADGSQTEAQFTIQVAEEPQTPDVGDPAPASQNRTLASEPDVAKLTSGTNPETGLYRLTVAEAIVSGRPTVVTLATPAFCQTRICAPVVDSVAAVYAEYGDQANFIHLEIYKDFQALTLADEVEQWSLPSEPWTFVLDENGVVAARFGGPLSPRELTAALVPLLS
jgi:hypothetical protein